MPALADSKQVSKSADPWDAPDPALALALQQIDWFSRHRNQSRRIYQVNEALVLVVSAATTLAAALKASAWLTAVLAAGTGGLTGLYQGVRSQEKSGAFRAPWSGVQTAGN